MYILSFAYVLIFAFPLLTVYFVICIVLFSFLAITVKKHMMCIKIP